MRVLPFLAAFAFMSLALAAPRLEPGISLRLAQWRAKQYRDLRYDMQIALREGAETLSGHLRLQVTIPRRKVDLVLDWRGKTLANLKVNDASAPIRIEKEHLVIPARDLKAGRNILEVDFEARVAVSGAAVTRYKDREDGAEYLYTLFVPSDASTVFPCFDQPDLKARFTLALDVPAGWTAVSNGREEGRGERTIPFKTTEPISTYLFAFAAGPFDVLQERDDPVRLFVRRSRHGRALAHAAEVLRLNRESSAWFSRYFAREFPFAKYDLVLLPEFPYGGMEHAGATFLNEERVVFPAPPSATDLLRRAQLVFHETSHQWFGDLVTMRWFDDLWLKEGFANFMAAKATEAVAPQFDAWTAFNLLKLSAVRTDATEGTTAIRYPLENLSAAKSAYGPIVYSKGPALLRQLEFFLDEDRFRQGVRAFLKAHAYGAADWQDLVRAFERASGKKLDRWAKAWVQRRGEPVVRVREGVLEQSDSLNEGVVWPMKLRVWGSNQEVFLERKAKKIKIPDQKVIFPNAGDYGYGRFLLDPSSREAALSPGFEPGSTLLDAQLAEALWESVRDAELDPKRYLEYAIRRLPAIRDDIALAGMLGRIEAAFRRYLSDAQRDRAAPGLERALREPGAQGSRYLLLARSFIEIAWSGAALHELKVLLRDTRLGARDRFRIVQRLYQRGDPEAAALLAREAAADQSDDGRRYAFAAAAADAGAKRARFREFLDRPDLPESWIEAALAPLNAPEQAALTQPLLAEALERLPELKRRRKIFFVNNWLYAFLGGQTSAASLAEAKAFLRETRLDADLRLKVLEAMDGLERAVRIRERFAG
ncbi:MAG TPA: M1 family aminopeptidase [Burkholderiales bacterium]|nr:M1 family aminopeptidase [Burkholderiales bacterium]